jgi:energy-coupling factor transport system ATP-binding protein
MLIKVEEIYFHYPKGVQALRGVSLTIQQGERVALIGQNGSGKTTLARHLNGLLHPQRGIVWIGDWQTSQHTPSQMTRRVAYAFQNPDEQLFRFRVWDEVAFGPQMLGFSSSQVQTAVEQSLELFGLKASAQLNPRDLGYSGRKRVTLACAFAMQTPIVVLDEPTAGLDAGEQARLAEAIHFIHQQERTVLVISHDMDFIAENMERVILLKDGQVVLDASTEVLFAQTRILEETAITAPQLVRLGLRLGHSRPALNAVQFLDNFERTRLNQRL